MRATIEIEFSPGTTIEDAFSEAVRLSNMLMINTEFNFNGVVCLGRPGGDIKTGVDSFHGALANKTFKFASS